MSDKYAIRFKWYYPAAVLRAVLAKKALARELFLISFIAVLVQQYYNFVVINSIELLGASAVFMPIFVIIIAIALLCLSIKGKQQGWLQ